MSSRASAGGSGNSGGVANENRNLAWVAAHAAADVPLPIVRTSGIRVEHVGAQTGMGVDDVGIITDQGGFVLLGAKKNLGLDEPPGSPLAKALDQVVEQYVSGVPDGSGALRPLDPERDLLVMTTDSSAPASVRVTLAKLISNLASEPGYLDLPDAAHDDQQKEALPVLRGHLLRSRHWSAPPTEDDIRALLRVLRLQVLGLEPDGEQRAVAEVRLTQVLADRSQQGGAFEALTRMAGMLGERRWWMSRRDILAWLRDNRFPLLGDPRVHADMRELRGRSARDLDADMAAAAIGAPGGRTRVDRDIEQLLADDAGTVVVIGPPGAGKTSVAARVALAERDAGRDVVYLRAGDLIGTDGEIQKTLHLGHDLGDVLDGWMGPGPGTLVIDGLDATRMAAPSQSLLTMLGRLPSRWRLIATARAFDLRHSLDWKSLFAGVPVDNGRADPRLLSVRHLLVGGLSDGEVSQLLAARPELAPLFDKARPRLADLVRNPFNLNLAAGLLSGNPDLADKVRSQLDLLKLYWDERVAAGTEVYARLAVLEKLAQEMIRQRRDRLHRPQDVLTATELQVMEGLLRADVLRQDEPSGYSGPHAPVAFAHALLFDFTVATQVLERPKQPMHLAEALSAEPDWALLLRSALDLHLAALWHGDHTREAYFALATRLAAQHPLAANAAAEVPVRESLGAGDLEPLIGRCLAAAASEERQAARRFTSQLLARALYLPDISAEDRATAVLALAAAGRRLAEAAERTLDVGLATTAAVVVNRIRFLPGWQPDWPGAAADCGMAAAAITRTALAAPRRRGHEHLAYRAAHLLIDAVRIDPGRHGPLIARFGDPAVMAAWGVSAAGVLTRALADITAHAPGPATKLAVATWTFTEERNEVTSPSLSRLREVFGDRRIDLQGARDNVGTAFPAILDQNPPAAIELYLRVIEAAAPVSGDIETALLSPGDGTLAGNGQQPLAMMTSAIADHLDALARQPGNDPDPDRGHPQAVGSFAEALDQLARRLHSPYAWALLLSAGARKPTTLGLRLIPLLHSGPLLRADPASRAAARLIQALAPALDDGEHGKLEVAIVSLPATGYEGHLRDRLLGALDRTRITDAGARERLTALDAAGGPPRIEGPRSGAVRDISLSPAGQPRRSNLSRAADSVQDDIGRPASAARLRDSFLALHSQMKRQDPPVPSLEGQADWEYAATTAVVAAARLAGDPETRPDIPAGTAVLDTLLAPVIATGDRATAETGSLRAAGTTMARAAEGLLTLLQRGDWAASSSGARIGKAAGQLLEHDAPAVRAVAVNELHHILPEPTARYARINELIATEQADFLRAGLLRQLHGLLPDMPAEVDRAVANLGATGAWPELAAVPHDFDSPSPESTERPAGIDFFCQILIHVALFSGEDASRLLLCTWLDAPAAFCYRADRACLHLRDWLTAGNAGSTATREAAFALVTRPVTAAIALRPPAESTADGRTAFNQATRVAAAVSRNLKIIADPARELPQDFTALAFPLLEQLALVGTSGIAHDIVRVLQRIVTSDPKRALVIMAAAVASAPDYTWEADGARAVLNVVDTIVAQHRDRILSDPEWTSGLRRVLEGFVAQGVDEVIAMVHDLGDMFR